MGLSPAQRRVLEDRLHSGSGFGEIAERQGMTKGNAWRAYKEAVAKIRKRYGISVQ